MFFSPEPVLETGFSPEELEELLSFLDSTSFSEESNRTSDSSNQTDDSNADELRKRKRKLSNRESARRSRCRKKQHLEDLTEQLNRLTIENQDLKNHICLVMNRFYFVSRENECLRSECRALLATLSHLDRLWVNVESMHQPYLENQKHLHTV